MGIPTHAPNWHPDPDRYICPNCNRDSLLVATNMGVLGVGSMFECPACKWAGFPKQRVVQENLDKETAFLAARTRIQERLDYLRTRIATRERQTPPHPPGWEQETADIKQEANDLAVLLAATAERTA